MIVEKIKTNINPLLKRFQKKEKLNVFKDEHEYLNQLGFISRGIFHDLINPISTISMYIDNLNHTKILDDYLHKEDLINCNKELILFIEQLRHFISQNSEVKEIDLAKLCNRCLCLIKHRAVENNISLICVYREEIMLMCIPCRIQQILLTLINNSIDACINNERVKNYITISIEKTSRDIYIKINDSGCGLHNNPKEKKTFSNKLGLRNARKIIKEEYFGEILLGKTDASGTEMIIRIPLN